MKQKLKLLITHQSVYKYKIFVIKNGNQQGWYKVYIYKLNKDYTLKKRPEVIVTPWWIDAKRIAKIVN